MNDGDDKGTNSYHLNFVDTGHNTNSCLLSTILFMHFVYSKIIKKTYQGKLGVRGLRVSSANAFKHENCFGCYQLIPFCSMQICLQCKSIKLCYMYGSFLTTVAISHYLYWMYYQRSSIPWIGDSLGPRLFPHVAAIKPCVDYTQVQFITKYVRVLS